MARPQNIKEETILEIAKPMFFKTGVYATEMKDVAAACGIGRSSLYRYFDSKESIAFALAEMAVRELFIPFEEGTHVIGTGYEKIAHGLLQFSAHMKQHPELLRFLDDFDCYFSDSYPSSESAEAYIHNMKSDIGFLTIALNGGVADGSIKPLDNATFTARFMVNIMLAAGQRILPRAKLLRQEQGYAEEYIDATVQLLLDGVVA